MAQEKHFLIICGEASGDLNAANLVKAIKSINPGVKISGVGGTLLRKAGAEIFHDIKDLAVMGFFDVIKKLPKFFALKKIILEKIKLEKPDAIILVDFSGFNLRLARAINKTIPVIYYVSPQVWASRPKRVIAIKKYVHKMIVLFKFEQEFYKKSGMDVDFVGHPLLDIVMPSMNRREFLEKFNLTTNKTTIALLPGSRNAEIEHVLPVMLDTAGILRHKIKNIQFIIAKSTNLGINTYYRLIKKSGVLVKLIENKTYDCLSIADFSLVCSGTATLETAIMQRPFCVVYKMNPLNYLLYRPQVKLPYIGMANIIAGKKIVAEFIQFQANPLTIANYLVKILDNPAALTLMQNEFSRVKSILGEKGASLRAAKIILDYLK